MMDKGKIPIHLYRQKRGLLGEKVLRDINLALREGISALWLEVMDKRDIDFGKRIASRYPVDVVSLVKNPLLIDDVLKSPVKGIAIELEFYKYLFYYKETLIQRGIQTFIELNGRNSVFEKEGEPYVQFEKIEKTVKEFKENGLENLSLHMHHQDAVSNFYINKGLKEHFNLPLVLSLDPHHFREKLLLVNSLSLGSLFYEKIGDILLLNFTPEQRYRIRDLYNAMDLGKKILGSLDLYPAGYKIISCPTCGRCEMDIPRMTERVDREMKRIVKNIKREGKSLESLGGMVIAVMGCNVNGPGEAKAADVGIAGGENRMGVIFKRGKPIKTLPEERLVDELILQVRGMIGKRGV